MKKHLPFSLLALLALSACGTTTQAGKTRRTVCGAATAACAMVNAYCAMPEADVVDPPP